MRFLCMGPMHRPLGPLTQHLGMGPLHGPLGPLALTDLARLPGLLCLGSAELVLPCSLPRFAMPRSSQGKASQAAEPNQPAQKSAFGLPGGSANKCGAPDRGASGGFFPAKTMFPGKQMSILTVFETFKSFLGPLDPN